MELTYFFHDVELNFLFCAIQKTEDVLAQKNQQLSEKLTILRVPQIIAVLQRFL